MNDRVRHNPPPGPPDGPLPVSRSFHPEIPTTCPKCGDIYGFLYTKPTYRYTNADLERLAWSCSTCDYTFYTLTVDHV